MKISSEDKKIIESIREKINPIRMTRENKLLIMDFLELYELLGKDEIKFLKKILKLKPKSYGIKAEYFGIKPVPKDLIIIKNQKYSIKEKTYTVPDQYLPKDVYQSFQKMSKSLNKETGGKLLVQFGYRSSASQVITLINLLNFYKYNFKRTIRRVAFPGYSEHGNPNLQAIDLMNGGGFPSDESLMEFAKTIEYKWLKKNARKFGFTLSYPRGNKLGMMFEPWHWRYEGA